MLGVRTSLSVAREGELEYVRVCVRECVCGLVSTLRVWELVVLLWALNLNSMWELAVILVGLRAGTSQA